MIPKVLSACIMLFMGIQAFAQDLSLGQDDLRIELRADGGFHLFVRKKPDIASVLITESTRDPAMGEDNFAYRAREWNPVNGDEIRLLNGFPIPRESGLFFLVSSTPVSHAELGDAFHIYIPWVLQYGYTTSRHGEIYVTEGTFFNIRAFNLPYADYRGSFADNPFILQAQRPAETPLGNYMEEAETAFAGISSSGGGGFLHAATPAELIEMIEALLLKETGKSVDIVLCMDTTGSMGPYIDEIRRGLIPMMQEIIEGFTEWRIGMVLFKDYFDEYLTRIIPFTNNFNSFQRSINGITARGGGDIPEAIFEALYDGIERFPWAAESRLIILIGDAPPHPAPRGRITREMVFQHAAENEIRINSIILAQ